MSPSDLSGLRFSVDTGGTFTDLIVEERRGVRRMFKAPTTPADPVAGVLDAVEMAARGYGVDRRDLLGAGEVLIHGTTHAINAIITGRTAKTAFLTTKGHPDILVLRMGGRIAPFDFTRPFPAPYVPRSLTFEVPGRIRADGSVMTPLDEAAVVDIAGTLKARQVEAVAVCLLWSIVNHDHELRVGALLKAHLPGVPVTLSHQLNPAIHEFKRASSAAVDASLKPLMGAYLGNLASRLKDAGFAGRVLMITSQAGIVDASEAGRQPIMVVNSGPSTAPVAGRHYARTDEGSDTAIIADTGGTTYDVSLVRRGSIPMSRETWIGLPFGGIMIGFPWVDVKSVGAGGGSIAWVDAGGLLRVGPKSAGAVPGPVAYGRGGVHPTVTDASVVLGHLDPDFFLGGTMRLDREAARAAVKRDVADPLGLSTEEAADAVLDVVTANMVRAINEITVEQGIDPRDAVLVGGGGAAGLNSVRIAKSLGCRTLLIPEVGAALSAAGALMSDLRADYRAAFFTNTAKFDIPGINAALSKLARRCREFAQGPGAGAIAVTISFRVEARYATEVWDIDVPLRNGEFRGPADVAAFATDFHAAHRELFMIDDPSCPVEIVGLSAQVACRLMDGQHGTLAAAETVPTAARQRAAWFRGIGFTEVPAWRLESLPPNRPVPGPAIIESKFTTVVVDPGAVARRRTSGSLSIDISGAE